MSIFNKKETKQTEYSTDNAYVQHRRKTLEKKVYDNSPKRYTLYGTNWTPELLTKLENHLKSLQVSFDSYPLKNGSWEIRFYGKYIGNWEGFEYSR